MAVSRLSPIETFKPVVGYEGYYEIGDQGTVRRIRRGGQFRILKHAVNRINRVHSVSLSIRNQKKTASVHRLVAIAFLGTPPDGHSVNHIDGDRHNNRVSNLEYLTPKQQMIHAVAIGLQPITRGEERGRASKLTNEIVLLIRKMKSQGVKAVDLAVLFDVKVRCIYAVLEGKTWSHVI